MKKSVQEMLKENPEISSEIKELLATGETFPYATAGISRKSIAKAMVGAIKEFPREEAMILMYLRPALLIRNNRIEQPDSVAVRRRLLPALPKLEAQVPSVGRIDLRGMGYNYAGTGWMITEDIMVTNRHVAMLFAARKGAGFSFRRNAAGDSIEAFIDFKGEYLGPGKTEKHYEIPVEKVLYMTPDNNSEPDIAFVRIARHRLLPPPIPLSDKALKKGQFISVIGYPAYDPDGIISEAAAATVFRDIYEIKRCSPGEIIEQTADKWYFFHDCTTLGGNSGSVILDNEHGVAVGLHFMGEVLKENYAVKASEIIRHLRKVISRVAVTPIKEKNEASYPEAQLESPAGSFGDRKGYDPLFLTKKVEIPVVKKGKRDVYTFKEKGRLIAVLKYHHFSVVMNKKRRLCFFSICNIDGKLSKRGIARTTWKTDGRMPKELQILKECYGNPPKFARGHMTRKEDPIWGALTIARAACADTFHVTNAVPQIQPFNAPVWLALEDYALENARQDHMKITVITGPVFAKDDPVRDGVQIPLQFFKIIVFMHDVTQKLTATGYTVSQEGHLGKKEFVFGQFNTYQCTIRSIERMTGLSFGTLSGIDPLRGRESARAPLVTMDEIQFS